MGHIQLQGEYVLLVEPIYCQIKTTLSHPCVASFLMRLILQSLEHMWRFIDEAQLSRLPRRAILDQWSSRAAVWWIFQSFPFLKKTSPWQALLTQTFVGAAVWDLHALNNYLCSKGSQRSRKHPQSSKHDGGETLVTKSVIVIPNTEQTALIRSIIHVPELWWVSFLFLLLNV